MKTSPCALLIAGLLLSPAALLSQSTSGPMAEALKLRVALATVVSNGTRTPGWAIETLKEEAAPKGMGLSRNAEFALAAIDIGQRLVAARQPLLAATFFDEAEISLNAALAQTPDSRATEKAMLLSKRGLVRSRYLGKGLLAKADFAEAIRLRPNDKAIELQRDRLLSADGEVSRAAARN